MPVTQNTKSRKGKTKIVKKGSIVIATTIKENIRPPAAGPSCAPKKAPKVILNTIYVLSYFLNCQEKLISRNNYLHSSFEFF